MLPSPILQGIIRDAETERRRGITMVMERQSEFPSMMQAQLTGIALDPAARDNANRSMDLSFESNQSTLPLQAGVIPELIIGSGFHAATYAANRVLMGKLAPYVFERSPYIGGAFAVRASDGSYPGVFNLNSRNRRGAPGLSGDNEAQLNYLPGAPIQASALSNAEYQSNADMAFVTRLTLAQYAPRTTFPGIEVLNVERVTGGDDGFGADNFRVTYRRNGSEREIRANRIIDARGLGDPNYADRANGDTVLTFPQFLQRMTQPWPLRGLRNVAVIGGGDSGKCTVESLLGLGPNPFMAAAELDSVNRVDWYAPGVSGTYEDYCRTNRGRYRAIGRYLRADKMGNQTLNVFNTREANPVALPGGPALVGGRSYDLVIVAGGNKVPIVSGLNYRYAEAVYLRTGDGGRGLRTIAKRAEDDYGEAMRFKVGPRAEIEFEADEVNAGVAEISNNRVAMFRLATRTAALAVQLS